MVQPGCHKPILTAGLLPLSTPDSVRMRTHPALYFSLPLLAVRENSICPFSGHKIELRNHTDIRQAAPWKRIWKSVFGFGAHHILFVRWRTKPNFRGRYFDLRNAPFMEADVDNVFWIKSDLFDFRPFIRKNRRKTSGLHNIQIDNQLVNLTNCLSLTEQK